MRDQIKFVNSPADDDGDDDHDHKEDNKAPTDHHHGEVGLGHNGSHRPVYLGRTELYNPVLAVCRYFYLDVALVAEPSDIPGLAGELPLHSLSDLELSGGGEDCRCMKV